MQDPLAHADAIVVLSGHLPERALEAARLYHAGYAEQVWVSQPDSPAEELKTMNIFYLGEDFYNEKVLLAQGVPAGFHSCSGVTRSRIQKKKSAKFPRHFIKNNFHHVILVTSKPHTRRVRTIWRKLVGSDPSVIVRFATDDPYDGAHWWRHTHDALDIVREILGLFNAWAGFPVAPEPELIMPVRPRKPNETAQQIMPLLLLGVGLVASNNYFTFIDDETWILDAATQPVRTTLRLFLSGAGQHEHPPLYDIVLHFWLRWTGGNFEYLRVPAILFFLAGLFLLGRAARRLGGPPRATAVIWLGVLWPFGFHYGRLAAWYSFSFFLVAGLTLAYLRYLDDQSPGRWAVLFLFGAALLWTNYFGWALLACLAADQFLRHRAGERTVPPGMIAGTAALFILSFVPLIRAFRNELGNGHSFSPTLSCCGCKCRFQCLLAFCQ